MAMGMTAQEQVRIQQLTSRLVWIVKNLQNEMRDCLDPNPAKAEGGQPQVVLSKPFDEITSNVEQAIQIAEETHEFFIREVKERL